MSLRHASAFAVCLPAMSVLHEIFHMLFLKATGGYIAWTSMCVVATSRVASFLNVSKRQARDYIKVFRKIYSEVEG